MTYFSAQALSGETENGGYGDCASDPYTPLIKKPQACLKGIEYELLQTYLSYREWVNVLFWQAGGPSVRHYHILNDKIHMLTKDTDGNVALYNVLKVCEPMN